VTNATGVFTGISAGTGYAWSITDANACGPVSGTLDVTGPAAITGSASVTTAIACNGGAGTVTLTGAGGTGALSYTFNGVTNATGIFTGISAGTGYAWSITDANACTPVTGTLDITQPSPLTGSIVNQTNVTVYGGFDGSVEIAAAGGTAPYEYSFNGGAFQVSGIFVSLTAGTHTVTIRDNKLCTVDVPVVITQPPAALSGSIVSQSNVTCFGTATGIVEVSGSGGLPPYEYQINGGAWQASGIFGSLTGGSYTITIRDIALHTFDVPVTIIAPAAPLTGNVISQTNVLCFGSNSGGVTVNGADGTGPYQYSIDGGSFQVSGTFALLVAGTHVVDIRDARLCDYYLNVVITEPAAALKGTVTAQTNVTCNGAKDGSVNITVTGGTTPYTFSIDAGAAQASGTFGGLLPGSHAVTVNDANLCSVNLPFTVTEPAALSIESSSKDVVCPGEPEGSLTLTITGGTQPYGVIWSDGNTSASRNNVTDGEYSAVVTDINGCAAALTLKVGVIGSEDCIQIPAIITPNNDGYNDTWKIRNIDLFPDAEVIVYNRWGKKVFETKNISANPWNGTLKGKLLPTDSYHYILDLHNGSKVRSGVISIIR
jgi:gliding motility-associated-like protein